MSVQEQFIFNHSFSEIHPLISRVLSVIEGNCAAGKAEALRLNCRMILMEFFTNALKHSEAEQTELYIEINEHQIKINKSDRGRIFYIKVSEEDEFLKFPFHQKLTGRKLIIYSDDICSLSGMLSYPNKITFWAEHKEPEPSGFSRLHEHYGLMIITKVSNDFFYEYDPKTGINLFSATISV